MNGKRNTARVLCIAKPRQKLLRFPLPISVLFYKMDFKYTACLLFFCGKKAGGFASVSH